MFDQHELYQGVHALIVAIGILYKKNRSHDNGVIGRQFFNNPLSPFLGSNMITPCLHDVGSLPVSIEYKNTSCKS